MGAPIRVVSVLLLGILLSCAHYTRPAIPVKGSPDRVNKDLNTCAPVSRCFFDAKTAYAQGNVGEAIDLLKSAQTLDPTAPWKGRILLLLGRYLEASGNHEATRYYEEALLEVPELGDAIMFSLGQLYLNQGLSLKGAEVLEELHRRYPNSALKTEALYQAAEAYGKSGEDTKAVETFELFLRLYPDHSNAASALFLMGKAYLNLHDTARAVELFRRVLSQYPQESLASSAKTELELLTARGVVIPALSPTEKVSQGKALYHAARYGEAVQVLQESLQSAPDPAVREELNLYLGISLVQLRRWAEAMKVFEILLKSHPDSDVAGETLSWFGRAALRQGDLDKLQWAQKTLKTRYPDRAEQAKVLWYLIFYYESKDLDQKAIQACRELIKAFPQDSLAQEAYWRIGWIHYKKGRVQEALKAFDELLDQYANTAFRPQVLYWKAKLLERNANSEKAQETYKWLCQEYARSYYCHRSRSHFEDDPLKQQALDSSVLTTLGQMESSLQAEKSEEYIPQVLYDNSQYQKARELMLTEFSEEAVRELTALLGQYTTNRQVLLFLADQLYALGAYDQSLRIIRLYFQETLEKGMPPMPNRFWEQAYPLGLMDRIVRLSDSDRLDPYVVASIIREESMYDPKAVSRAGAVGLMQVLPETGRWVANQLGMKEFQSDQLFDPEQNIRLGSWYLDHLFEQFNGNLVFSIAAYNAGPEVVTEWIQRGDYHDMDEFIEQIPFSETRLYVKRVLRSYYEYNHLSRCLYASPSLPRFLDKGICREYS
jgi:soluble lytic murein transglycosylase